MGEFYWGFAKSFRVLAILSLVIQIVGGFVYMLISISHYIFGIGLLIFILSILTAIIVSAPLYILGEVVDRIERVEQSLARKAQNNANAAQFTNQPFNQTTNKNPLRQFINKPSSNNVYHPDELRKMGLTTLKNLYESGEISQATYEKIKSEKMSNH